jgi:hypothetical protein
MRFPEDFEPGMVFANLVLYVAALAIAIVCVVIVLTLLYTASVT